jgi:hypothetical protein
MRCCRLEFNDYCTDAQKECAELILLTLFSGREQGPISFQKNAAALALRLWTGCIGGKIDGMQAETIAGMTKEYFRARAHRNPGAPNGKPLRRGADFADLD